MHYVAMRLRICTIYQFVLHSQSCCVLPDHHLTPTCTKETKSYLQERMGQHPQGHHEGWMESDQKTIFCWVPVPLLPMVNSSFAFFCYLPSNYQGEVGICFFWVIGGSGYLKIKNSKNHLDPVLLFLGDLKNLPRFRSWKSIEGWLWDGGRGRLCD